MALKRGSWHTPDWGHTKICDMAPNLRLLWPSRNGLGASRRILLAPQVHAVEDFIEVLRCKALHGRVCRGYTVEDAHPAYVLSIVYIGPCRIASLHRMTPVRGSCL